MATAQTTDGDPRGPSRGGLGTWGRVRGKVRPGPGLSHAARCQSDEGEAKTQGGRTGLEAEGLALCHRQEEA